MDLITFAKSQVRSATLQEFGGYWEAYGRITAALSARDWDCVARLLREESRPETPVETFADGILRLRFACLVNDVNEAERWSEYLRQHALYKDALTQATADFRIGIFHRQNLQFTSALSAQARAASIFRDLRWPLEEALCVIEIGSIFLQRGDLSGAVEKYASVLEALREHGTSVQYGRLLLNVAVNFHRAGNYEQAALQYDRLLCLAPHSDPGIERAEVLQRYAALSKQVGQLERAAEQYSEGLACLDQHKSTAQYADMHIGMADLALRRRDVATAQGMLDAINHAELSVSARIDYDAARALMLGILGRQSDAYELLSATLDRTVQAGLADQRHAILADALIWVTDDRLRIDILEQYRHVQDQRLRSLATGVNSIVEIRTRYEQERAQAELERQLELSRAIVDTQFRTSHEIGRDLHDSIGQDLTVLTRLAERLKSDSTIGTAEFDRLLSLLADVSKRAASEARRIAHRLSGSAMTGQGLPDAMALLREEVVSAVPELDLTVIVTDSLEEMPPDVARAILRIIQTVIQNVVRHSQARNCTVNLVVHDDEYYLGIEDDGVGFDIERVSMGLGLREMRARAELAGGNVRIESRPGNGTYIEVSIPRRKGESE